MNKQTSLLPISLLTATLTACVSAPPTTPDYQTMDIDKRQSPILFEDSQEFGASIEPALRADHADSSVAPQEGNKTIVRNIYNKYKKIAVQEIYTTDPVDLDMARISQASRDSMNYYEQSKKDTEMREKMAFESTEKEIRDYAEQNNLQYHQGAKYADGYLIKK